ncbi:hypothetical protein ACS0TY_026933 [Phlomoides rotata]
MQIYVESDFEVYDDEGNLDEDFDLFDSDFVVESHISEDDDEAFLNNVDDGVVEGHNDSVEDSGDDDIVCHKDDFDERRDSDEEIEQNQYPRFNNEVVFNPEFDEGMIFGTKEVFKKAVNSHAINTRRNLYFEKNDKIRIYAKCGEEDYARDKPIITMLEWIRHWLMERFQMNRDRAVHKWKGRLPPKITKILQKHMDRIGDCIPINANNRHYQIECSDGSQYAVD